MLPWKGKTEHLYGRVVIIIIIFTTTCQIDAILSPYAEDATLPVPDLLLKYGYPCEIHKVTTTDGYILTIHRIPHGKNLSPHLKRKPVLLSHGLTHSSADYLTQGPGGALGYILADAGYDVWLSNSRGTKYSREHVYLKPKDKEYWQFSWHEMGVYDLPTTIDYILQRTDFNCLYYIGHSQGTTAFFVMASERPEYNSKIHVIIAMAPAVFLSNTRIPILKNVDELPQHTRMQVLIGQTPDSEFFPGSELLTSTGADLCNNLFLAPICTLLHSGHPNVEHVGAVIGNGLEGNSVQQFVHYAQLIFSGKFAQFDYGVKKNMDKYGQPSPPLYNLSEITAPVILLYGGKDIIIGVKDVNKLYDRLSNSCVKCKVGFDNFTHMDFVLSEDAYRTVYSCILSILSKIERTGLTKCLCDREECKR